jgi:PPOX class probable F420-dependent enzyme
LGCAVDRDGDENPVLNFRTRFGRRVRRRLLREKVVWLTTIDPKNTPQPRPVWFHWDGRTMLVLSQPKTAKLRHVARNPNVSLNFNTDEDGDDVTVLTGSARALRKPPPARLKSYLRKYRQGIGDIGMTVSGFVADYSVAIVVTPRAMRGF